MPKRYWLSLIVYILFIFLLPYLLVPFKDFILSLHPNKDVIAGVLGTIRFALALAIMFFILRNELKQPDFRGKQSSVSETIAWMIGGALLAMFVQYVAAIVDYLVLGNKPTSENTMKIMEISQAVPWFIIAIILLGPIVEELVYRKIVFGSLWRRMNFILAALISSLLFAVIHGDGHIVIYGSIGFVFAYLYAKTNRIIVPITAHVLLNSRAILLFFFSDELQKYIEQYQQQLQIIWRFFT